MSALERIAHRPPTGRVAFPVVLLEGEEKAGKTYTAYQFTSSPRVGRCFVADLGEGSADEYAPIGKYDVLTPDPNDPLAPWTIHRLIEQVAAVRDFAREELAAGRPPVVLIIDSMSDEWGVLVDAITTKAARSDANQRKLRDDPAAEVKVPNHLWNDANAKHRRLMTLLLTFPGIVIITARGKEVAEIRNGAPVEGSKVWKVEGQKNLAFDATCWIRMHRNAGATLEGARSLYVGVRPGRDAPRQMDKRWDDGGLEWFIFEAYKLDPTTAHVRDLRSVADDGEPLPEHPAPAPARTAPAPAPAAPALPAVDPYNFVETVVRPAWNDAEGLRTAYAEILARGMFDATVIVGDVVTKVGELVRNRGAELDARAAEQPAAPVAAAPEPTQEPQAPAQGPAAPPAAEDPVARVLALVTAAQTVTDVRAAWALSGELGVRGVGVVDGELGETTIGTLIMGLGARLERQERAADHAERAAGEQVGAR